MRIRDITRTGLSRIETIRVVRTVVNPMLWLVGLATPLFLAAAVLIDDPSIRLILVGSALAVVFAAIAAYVFFAFRDPDRLQSEEYRIKMRELRLRYRKGRQPIVIDHSLDVPRIEQDGEADEDVSAGPRRR